MMKIMVKPITDEAGQTSEEYQKGTIVLVMSTTPDEPMTIKIGQTAHYKNTAGEVINLDGEDHVVLFESETHMIV